MAKVLILGVRGNLGGQIRKVFEDGNEIIAWDREEIDITDKDLVRAKILDLKPEIVINTVAYNAVDKCEEDENEFLLAQKINGEAVGYLADICLQLDAILVHYSTDYVFDGQTLGNYNENSEPNPISKYGLTKLMGEQELIKRKDQGLKYYLIRTSKLFGPRGDSPAAKPSFFDLMLNLSATNKELKVIDGEELSCFTYTVDLAHTTKKIIDHEKGFGIYHVVNSGVCSWYEGVKFLFELKNITDVKLIPIDSSQYPRPAKRPRRSALISIKLEPLRKWQDALKEYLEQ